MKPRPFFSILCSALLVSVAQAGGHERQAGRQAFVDFSGFEGQEAQLGEQVAGAIMQASPTKGSEHDFSDDDIRVPIEAYDAQLAAPPVIQESPEAENFEAASYAAFNGDGSLFETPMTINRGQKASTYPGEDGFALLELPYKGEDLSEAAPEERAREGLFLAFQYPVEIPGVSNVYFLKAALNAIRKHRGQEEMDAMDFLTYVREKMALVRMDEALLNRPVNEGFSGGEKKRNEIFHMAVLDPVLAVLDETDSGLDIDALKIVADGVNSLRSEDRAFVVITHYQRLLNYIVPDVVHVLVDGKIVRSGGKELALELEDKGYAWLEGKVQEAAAANV